MFWLLQYDLQNITKMRATLSIFVITTSFLIGVRFGILLLNRRHLV